HLLQHDCSDLRRLHLMKVQKVYLWFVCMMMLAVLLAACTAAPAAAPASDTTTDSSGAEVVDELIVAQTAEIPTLDAHLDWTMIGRNIYYQMYGYLTRHDENMVVVPELAESWEFVDDLTMRWHLRQ